MYLNFIYNSSFQLKPLVLSSFYELIDYYGFKVYEGRDKDVKGNIIKDRYFNTLDNGNCSILLGFGLESQYSETRYFILEYFPTKTPYCRFGSPDLISFRNEPTDILNPQANESWDSELNFISMLQKEAKHTLKYRKDILSGDFSNWRMNYLLAKYGSIQDIPLFERNQLLLF